MIVTKYKVLQISCHSHNVRKQTTFFNFKKIAGFYPLQASGQEESHCLEKHSKRTKK